MVGIVLEIVYLCSPIVKIQHEKDTFFELQALCQCDPVYKSGVIYSLLYIMALSHYLTR